MQIAVEQAVVNIFFLCSIGWLAFLELKAFQVLAFDADDGENRETSNPQNEGIILFHRFISIEAFAASPGCNELTNLDTYESNIHDNLYLFFSSKSKQIG